MPRQVTRLLLAFIALCTLLVFPRIAFAAPSLDECVAASEKGDKLRRQSSLRAARTSYIVCADQGCPAQVRDDCNLHMNELETAMPTVVFNVRDGEGDATAVTVLFDGEPLVTSLDGKPVPVDPGEHTFTFKLKEYPEQTKKILVREGEKGRAVAMLFGDAKPPVPMGRLVVDGPAGAAIAIDGHTAVGGGHVDTPIAAGGHEVRVTETGKATYTKFVEVKAGDTQTLDVVLEDEKKKSSMVPWIIGGAAVVVAAIVIGGVVAFSSGDSSVVTTPLAPGSAGGISFKGFRFR